MNLLPFRRPQRGYLLEIPILFVLVVIVLTVVLPYVPPWGQKIAVGIAGALILFFLFYMIVIPGWTPGYGGRLKWPWNWVVFVPVAALVIIVVVAFMFA